MDFMYALALFMIGGLFGMLIIALVVMSRDIGDK